MPNQEQIVVEAFEGFLDDKATCCKRSVTRALQFVGELRRAQSIDAATEAIEEERELLDEFLNPPC